MKLELIIYFDYFLDGNVKNDVFFGNYISFVSMLMVDSIRLESTIVL